MIRTLQKKASDLLPAGLLELLWNSWSFFMLFTEGLSKEYLNIRHTLKPGRRQRSFSGFVSIPTVSLEL